MPRIKVAFSKEWKDLDSMLGAVEPRVNAAARLVLRTAAEAGVERLKKKLTGKEAWINEYKKLLTWKYVYPMPGGDQAVMIMVDQAPKRLTSVDARRTLVTFELPQGEQSELGAILVEYGPWAVDQLPIVPSDFRGKSKVRLVTPGEVMKARARNLKNRSKVSARLRNAGEKVSFSGFPRLDGKPVFDLEFSALRLEFGIGAVRMPHWRPLRQWMYQGGLERFLLRPKLGLKMHKYLAEPRYTGWKVDSRKPPGNKTLPFSRLRGYRSFQRMIGQNRKPEI